MTQLAEGSLEIRNSGEMHMVPALKPVQYVFSGNIHSSAKATGSLRISAR